jgi:hypothetical protein
MRIAATRFAWPPEDVDISAIPASSGAVEERRRERDEMALDSGRMWWKKKSRKGLPEFGEVGTFTSVLDSTIRPPPTSLRC